MEQEDKNLTKTFVNSSSEWIPEHDFLVTILIPSLLLFILLLVAIMNACILHRKRSERMMTPGTRILSPRTPVIFASEPGRYSEDGVMQKRLFSDDENADHAPDYDDMGGRKQDGTGNSNQNRQISF
jgi:hypothetical protein